MNVGNCNSCNNTLPYVHYKGNSVAPRLRCKLRLMHLLTMREVRRYGRRNVACFQLQKDIAETQEKCRWICPCLSRICYLIHHSWTIYKILIEDSDNFEFELIKNQSKFHFLGSNYKSKNKIMDFVHAWGNLWIGPKIIADVSIEKRTIVFVNT